MKRIRRVLDTHKQFIFYSIIGVSGVCIDVMLFFILYNFFNFEKNIATFLSLTVAITNNFIWNIKYNFKVDNKIFKRFSKFYIVGLTGFIVTALLFLILTDWLGISANITKLVSLLPILILQYTINKLWSFKNYEKI